MHIRIATVAFLVLSTLPVHVVAAATSCAVPLTYSIASIDTRFNVSQTELVADLGRAAAVWNTVSSHTVLAYASSTGAVRVSLVYDNRQAQTDKERAILTKLSLVNKSFEALFAQYTRVASSTEMEQKQLGNEYDNYQATQDTLNAEITASNAQGGASPAVYAAFAMRTQNLKSQFDQLKTRELELNDRVVRINTLGGLLNALAKGVDAYIARYNAQLASMQSYEEGLYQDTGTERTIQIFQFADTDHLVRALAHELGHSLGMEHVSDADAIMYKSNEGSGLTPTPADMMEFGRVCGPKI